MVTELDVLGIVGDRLAACDIPFMLTGSFAMAHYTTPRMTRDIDLVVTLRLEDVQPLVSVIACSSFRDGNALRWAPPRRGSSVARTWSSRS
jgi:hypothetical protein